MEEDAEELSFFMKVNYMEIDPSKREFVDAAFMDLLTCYNQRESIANQKKIMANPHLKQQHQQHQQYYNRNSNSNSNSNMIVKDRHQFSKRSSRQEQNLEREQLLLQLELQALKKQQQQAEKRSLSVWAKVGKLLARKEEKVILKHSGTASTTFTPYLI